MSFWVYGDVHTHIDAVKRFLEHQKPSRVIWLGDWLDRHSEQDGPLTCIQVAIFLKNLMLARPQDIFIMGNHELAYRYPNVEKYRICGGTAAKVKAFNEHFPPELWKRFVLAHVEEWNGQTILFSHAGFTKRRFPFGKFDKAHLERISKIAIEAGAKSDDNVLLDDWSEGPMWMRWQYFPLFEGICQVVGHTTYDKPQIRAIKDKPEWNLGMDCAHTYYAVFKEKHAYAINRKTGSEHLLRFNA